MGFLLWIIIGGIAGWIASMIMKTDAQQGVLLNILVGIVGGLVGGWVLGLFGFQPEGNGLIASLLTAVLGAVILLGVVRAVTGRRPLPR
ncbi:GlsB/YeaQ/YmgE family stress response membrane protein [Propioniciclava tarda]|uniref:GlsB/YeaQ/YmgE family stress response membrane protein n=1 Tax=Propioniciclava tarda TaxID=433330 RepID=A0A4Q9KMG7_PROTD|nr:GlsB/YeaQ/YmgE family stress response membrane protein [Propioniciclava tarda]TBT94939.1 GlsB/YeaQ/YmgE family stress response membrane protein [Propioniciclava tarda]SMO58075.1 Uncharacterized membrane protein YeaQ/YmgE, transglycosylase-associated protein family [Propioniciclava tarda]